jgi:hypothetical protein
MHTYAVAYMNYFENDLTIELVVASNEIEAIFEHSAIGCSPEDYSNDLEKLKTEFFDQDLNVDVKKVM